MKQEEYLKKDKDIDERDIQALKSEWLDEMISELSFEQSRGKDAVIKRYLKNQIRKEVKA